MVDKLTKIVTINTIICLVGVFLAIPLYFFGIFSYIAASILIWMCCCFAIIPILVMFMVKAWK
jgi:hypothetical protein